MFKGRNLPFMTEKDSRIKLMNERINSTEKHFEELCSIIGAYTRKLARFRDKNDDLAKAFYQYSEGEQINKTLSNGVKSFSKALTIIADYLDLEVHRIELKIINELAQYENICKNTRESLRTISNIREKEIQRQKHLIDIKAKFSANTSAADSELLKANLEVNRTNKQIEEIIENFEKQKLQDLKMVLQDFLLIQIKQYTKVTEILSAVYYDVSNINETQDFQDFKRLLKSKNKTKIFGTRENFRSQSLDNLSVGISPLRQKRNNFSNSSRDFSITGTDEENNLDQHQDDSEYGSDEKSFHEKDTSTNNDDTASDSERNFELRKKNFGQKENVFKAKTSREGIPDSSPLATISTRTQIQSQGLMSVKSMNGVTKYQAINLNKHK
ncbi:CBY1-interacting BAR domain-containing protein homolog [Condylostylus longicornis]|uniref:CBY1-interacting BAR domain-containing protein homolog n=1 Tax=Condylostylus longicornis TaxID=2530218 RepID=UPI00244DD0CA|nr:CBY1-interacting BAR domain-containing protein homolog [Condylostylus longicornis]